MHELAVTQSILDIALRHAEEAGAKRILQLDIVIGQLASIVDDSVQFYWDIITEDTLAEGSVLNFKRLPTILQCVVCSSEYSPDGNHLACPDCESTNVKVISGKEFYLEAIDISEKSAEIQSTNQGRAHGRH